MQSIIINGGSTSSPPHMGKDAKETSELVVTDPNKNGRMSECLLDGDVKILTKTPAGKKSPSDKGSNLKDNAEFSSWKNKEKRKKQKRRHNPLQTNVIDHDHLEDTPISNSLLEINSQTCTVDGISKTGLETIESAGLSSRPGRKRRSNRKRKDNIVKCNDVDHDHVDSTSLVKNTPMESDSFTQPLVDPCLKENLSVTQYDVEASLSQDMNKEKEQKKRYNASEINSFSYDLEEGDGRLSMDSTNIKYLEKVGLNSSSIVAEQVNACTTCLNTSSARKHDDNAEVDITSVEARGSQRLKTYCRKKRKVCNSLGNSLVSMKKGVGSSILNNVEYTSLDSSDEALASGCSKNMLEREVGAANSTLLQVVEDISAAESSGGCSDGELPSEESKKRIEMETFKQTVDEDGFVNNGSVIKLLDEDSQQANGGKINIIQNAVQNTYSVEENLVETTIFKEDKSFVDASGSDISCEHHDKKILKIQSEMENAISSSSQLGANKDDVGLLISKDDHSLCVVGSSPERALACHFRRKLLILDVNGLLADIVPFVSGGYEADAVIGNKAVFRRPFCNDFLQFCFARFNVGVWSSRTKRNVELVLDFLMRKDKHKLLFCWDQSHCTDTGHNTVENRDKPMLLKELKKLWKKHEQYNESNTLLLDDSPYKALCNPQYTAIFPRSYHFKDVKDNSLGPGGDLRVYLEGLSLAENVQKYVEQNPFGQRPITERNLSWAFYLKVIHSVSSQPGK